MKLYSCIFLTMILTQSKLYQVHINFLSYSLFSAHMQHYTAPLMALVWHEGTRNSKSSVSSGKQSPTLVERIFLPLCWDKHNWKFLPSYHMFHQRSFLHAYLYTPHLVLSSFIQNSTVDPNLLCVMHFTCVGYLLFVLLCYVLKFVLPTC